MKKIILLLGLFLIAPAFISCEKDEDENAEAAPALPPYESMFIDFGNLVNTGKSYSDLEEFYKKFDPATTDNFTFAATTVTIWNLILTITFVVPVAAFYHSFAQTPTYLGDAKWEWSYQVLGIYNARLTGEVRLNDIKWEMFIEKTGQQGHPEFKWFDGTSDLNGMSGQWTLYHSYEFPDEVIVIDWEKSGNEIGSVTYNYVRVLDNNGNPDFLNGSYLSYGLQDSEYDAYYTLYFYDFTSEAFYDVFIEMNTTDYHGRVKAEYHFDDSDWHCWDTDGNDIDCVVK